MIRQDIKNAIQASLQSVTGVKKIFTARQKLTQNQNTPCITIYLPDVKENQQTSGIPQGKRKIELTGLLEVIMIDTNSVPEIGEAAFDNILDEIDAAMRTNFTLQGYVNGAAIKNLETHVAAPQLVEGQNILRIGLKKFDILLQITGVDSVGQYIYMI